MSNTNLIAQITALATRAATEDKTLHGLVATAQTTANTATTNLGTLTTTVGGITTNVGTLANLTTTHKTDVVTAINDVVTLVGTAQSAATAAQTTASSAAVIDDTDTGTSLTKTYSAKKITDKVAAAVSGLVAAAPGTLDTLKELADAINDDANFSTTITTAIGGKLAIANNLSDVASVSTTLTNLGVYSKTAVDALFTTTNGNVTTNTTALATLNTAIGTLDVTGTDNPFTAAFEAALA